MIRRWFILLPVLLLVAFALPAQAERVVLQGGRLFDGVTAELVANPGILVVNGRFHRIGVGEDQATGARVVQLADDDTVLPGLIDLHAHYNLTLNEIRREETDVMPVIYLANGVTSTFPAGSFNPKVVMDHRCRYAGHDTTDGYSWARAPDPDPQSVTPAGALKTSRGPRRYRFSKAGQTPRVRTMSDIEKAREIAAGVGPGMPEFPCPNCRIDDVTPSTAGTASPPVVA